MLLRTIARVWSRASIRLPNGSAFNDGVADRVAQDVDGEEKIDHRADEVQFAEAVDFYLQTIDPTQYRRIPTEN